MGYHFNNKQDHPPLGKPYKKKNARKSVTSVLEGVYALILVFAALVIVPWKTFSAETLKASCGVLAVLFLTSITLQFAEYLTAYTARDYARGKGFFHWLKGILKITRGGTVLGVCTCFLAVLAKTIKVFLF